MGRMRMLGGGAAMAALALGAIPAEAGGRGRHHHRPAARVKAGDVLLGAALIGVVAAVASRKSRPAIGEAPLPTLPPIDAYGPPADGLPADGPPVDPAEAAAVDGCLAQIADNYADDEDRYARVEEITSVEPTAKGFRVRGRVRIEERLGFERLAKFRCSISRSGRTRSLTIS